MVLFSVPWPPQGIYAKKDINTIDDMKGLKWRAYNVGTARIGELVGAQAVTVPAAETPPGVAAALPLLGPARVDPAQSPLRHQGGVRRARKADPGSRSQDGEGRRGSRL